MTKLTSALVLQAQGKLERRLCICSTHLEHLVIWALHPFISRVPTTALLQVDVGWLTAHASSRGSGTSAAAAEAGGCPSSPERLLRDGDRRTGVPRVCTRLYVYPVMRAHQQTGSSQGFKAWHPHLSLPLSGDGCASV